MGPRYPRSCPEPFFLRGSLLEPIIYILPYIDSTFLDAYIYFTWEILAGHVQNLSTHTTSSSHSLVNGAAVLKSAVECEGTK